MVDTPCMSGDQCRTPPPTTGPLCDGCLTTAHRDTRALLYDYLDLAQLHEASLSQAMNEHVTGSPESPLLIAGHVEALQAEIVHVTTTWETELRAHHRLTHGYRLPIAAWHTTTTHPTPPVKVRGGAAVQRAIGVIAPRLRVLAQLPAAAVCRTGVQDDPENVTGWEAVHHLQQLHGRARGMLGRTVRAFWIPGDCWTCAARQVRGVDGPLCRSEPRYPGDPLTVNCNTCSAARPYSDYEHYTANLGRWANQNPDSEEAAAA